MNRVSVTVLASILLSACQHTTSRLVPVEQTPPQTVQSESMTQWVSFETDDGVVIVGNWYPVDGALRVVLLLHMMPATKESWEALAQELNRRGIAALAIDLRGHGESTKKGVGGSGVGGSGVGGSGVGGRERQEIHFQSFTDAEHQESIRDVRAAVEWLKTREFEKDQILLIGASIGANLALSFASQTPEITRIVLLSPGLDYRGVETEPAISLLTPDSLFFIIVAQDDEYAYESSKILKDRHPSTNLTVVVGSAHGTDLFDDHPEMLTHVADFLSR